MGSADAWRMPRRPRVRPPSLRPPSAAAAEPDTPWAAFWRAVVDRFVRPSHGAWSKRFPDEFYRQIFRLRGWAWRGMGVNRPQAVAGYTRDLVYARLPPGVLAELDRRLPIEDGRRPAKFHQLLTDDVGHPALALHLHGVIGFMRASTNWCQLMSLVDVAYPKYGATLMMPFMAWSPP